MNTWGEGKVCQVFKTVRVVDLFMMTRDTARRVRTVDGRGRRGCEQATERVGLGQYIMVCNGLRAELMENI